MGFTRAELESLRDSSVPDLIGPHIRMLFVGINPGLWSAATGTHFAHPGNRFYPALALAGIIPHSVEAAGGLSDADRRLLVDRGIGITNLVNRATARASEVTTRELRDGARRVERLVQQSTPAVVAFAGVTAYRTAYSRPKAQAGPQRHTIHGASAWVVPNPSGINTHETTESLAQWFGRAAAAAGID